MPLPWFKKQGEELPSELQNMEPADLVAAVQASRELAEVKQQLQAAQQRGEEVDELKGRIAELTQRLEQHLPTNNNGGDRNSETPLTDFIDDGDKAFNERFAPHAMQLYTVQAQNAKFIARQSINGVDAQIWDKYGSEIDEVMKTVAIQFQAMPQTWLNALQTVAGRHMKDLLKMQSDKAEFFAEAAGSSGTGGPSSNQNDVSTLNDEEKRVASRMGIPETDYLKYKKEMTTRA